jgi:hypothetical protein
MDEITIVQLNPPETPSKDHAIAAMKDGETVKLTVAEILALASGDYQKKLAFVTKTASYLALPADDGAAHDFTSTATLTLTAAATLGAGWSYVVWANGAAVTIDPDGSEQINGASTLVLADGEIAKVYCDGSAFKAIVISLAGNTNTHGLTEKTVPVDDDELRITDSAASFVFKRLKFSSLEAWVKGTLPITKYYESAEQIITSAGSLTLAHGLGVAPKFIAPVLICKTAENGYSVGDIVPASYQVSTSSADVFGMSAEISSDTSISVRFGSNAAASFLITQKDTGAGNAAANANWRLIMRAFA